MLVITRKSGETLLIGKDIVVTVNRVAGGRVSLGVEAPASVRIVRGEIADEPRNTKPQDGGNPDGQDQS